MTESKTGVPRAWSVRGCCRAPGKAPDSYSPGGRGRLGPEAQAVGGKWLQVLVCVRPSEGCEPCRTSPGPLLSCLHILCSGPALGKCLLHEDRGLILSQGVRGWVRARRGWHAGCLLITGHLCTPAVVGEPSLQRPPPLQPESQATRSVSNQRLLAQPCAWPWGFGGGQDLVYTTVAALQGWKPP